MIKYYVTPFFTYLLGTGLVAQVPLQYYPLGYTLVVVITTIVTAISMGKISVIKPHFNIVPAILVGLVGITLWIGLCQLHLEERLTAYLPEMLRPAGRVSYNPLEQIGNPVLAWCFIAIRIAGIALIVPLVEEIFWRGFLLRWFIDLDWEAIPIAKFTLSSCLYVTLMFTLAHQEWLAAAGYCLLINGLLYWRRDLWSCVVAHGVTNLALAIYILATGTWSLW